MLSCLVFLAFWSLRTAFGFFGVYVVFQVQGLQVFQGLGFPEFLGFGFVSTCFFEGADGWGF